MSKLNNTWHKLAIPGFAEPCGRGGRRGSDDAADGIRRRRNHLLAVLLPDGTALNGKEVDMWLRSQVERLTGLSESMIQSLCYQNTKHGGLGFWEPAVSKPGYSRFDEGDLLMFYLVGQLKRAGFTLKEVEATVYDLLEEDGALDETLRAKARMLHAHRAKLDDQLAVLERFEEAAEEEPGDRFYAVMEMGLKQSAVQALEAAAPNETGRADEAERVRSGFERFIRELLAELKGDKSGEIQKETGLSEGGRCVGRLIASGASPSGEEARTLIHRFALQIAGSDDEAAPASQHAQSLAHRTLALFLNDAANGVPVELVFGNGSFAFLAQAAKAWADTKGSPFDSK